MTQPIRKPRIAFMGEFSAGKSTLTNLLLGGRPLPEKVTATRLSPVWMSHGSEQPYRIGVDGTRSEISLDALEDIPLEETRVIRMFFEADILEICDLIDFPGISDPNMSSDVWQRVLEEVDAIIWCTHATQAWRQSEAAVWETIPQEVRERSILLITRFDKLVTVRDEQRVLARLQKETAGQFGGMFPISLTDALAAGEDDDAFEAAGGTAFLVHVLAQIKAIAATAGQTPLTLYQSAMGLEASVLPQTPIQPAPVAAAPAARPAQEAPAPSANPVIPRRVRPASGGRSARPARPAEASKVVSMTGAEAPAQPAETPGISASDLRSVFQ